MPDKFGRKHRWKVKRYKCIPERVWERAIAVVVIFFLLCLIGGIVISVAEKFSIEINRVSSYSILKGYYNIKE
jgi:hypothetical protein